MGNIIGMKRIDASIYFDPTIHMWKCILMDSTTEVHVISEHFTNDAAYTHAIKYITLPGTIEMQLPSIETLHPIKN